MKVRSRSGPATVACFAAALFAAVVMRGGAPTVAAGTPGDSDGRPRSCKPTSPVQVTLEASPAGAGSFVVRAAAAAATRDVSVTLREDGGRTQSVWRGSLAEGESRTFTVRFPVRSGAAALFAEAEVLDVPGMVQRAAAALVLSDGRPRAAHVAATPEGARFVPGGAGADPVLELPGAVGTGR